MKSNPTVNLLKTPITTAEIERILAAAPRKPLLPPRGDAAWAAVARKPVAQAWLPELRRLAEKELTEPLPVLTDELYAEYHRTGVRTSFQSVYFERRGRLARAVICALLEADARWMESVLAKVPEIFAEVSWALQAHVDDPSGKDPMRID